MAKIIQDFKLKNDISFLTPKFNKFHLKNVSFSKENSNKKTPLLDKLAQLSSKNENKPLINTRETLRKRAKAKFFTNALTKQLATLKSPLQKSYNNTIFGCSNVLVQNGEKITGKYCNNRWCLVCNRIRTAKLICGYKETLQNLPDLQFLTLTIPSVPAETLKETLENMAKTFNTILKTLNRKYKRSGSSETLKGLRKIECTVKVANKMNHPHFHVLISGYENALNIKREWLKHYPTAEPYLQNIRKADNNTFMELFKYYTKITTNKVVYIELLDVIFQAMRNKRVYQPFGIKKCVTEDIEKLQAQITDLEAAEKIWMWEESDWIEHETGECLTGYEPDETTKKLISNIKHV